jgi:serine/threonine-protein kinase
VKLRDRPADVPSAMSTFSEVELEGAITGAERAGIGDRIGPYRLARALGAGARERLFEVAHLTTGDRAAMKLLPPGSLAAAGGAGRVRAEAQALSEIGSPHIVALIDAIEGDGCDAVVTELVQGRSLAQLIADQGPLPVEQFLPILIQVLDALGAAHGALLVHRHLSPERVCLISGGETGELVKLAGFGLAGELGARAPGAGGDPEDAYRSPEQLAGASIDQRSDIYSFGVILYELLCGRLPFEPLTAGSARAPGSAPGPTPSAVLESPGGRALDALARRCLREDPAERFASVHEMTERLVALAVPDEGSYRVPEDWTYEPAPSPLRRWGLMAAVGLVVLGGGALLVARMGRDRPASVLASNARSVPPAATAPVVTPPPPPAVAPPTATAPAPAPAAAPVPDSALASAPKAPPTLAARPAAPEPPAPAPERVEVAVEPRPAPVAVPEERGTRALPGPSARRTGPSAGPPPPSHPETAPSRAGKPSARRSLAHEGTVDPFN